jgi:ferritin-like metal-binding protein YciE
MAKTERSGHTTTDHDFIRRWVEERGGWPARVKGTGGSDDPGLIRVDFPGFSGEGSLERIEWEEWFQGFDGNNLAFLHRDMDHGGGDLDRFNKLVSRSGSDDQEEEPRGKRTRSSTASSSRSGGSSSARKSASAGSSDTGKRGGTSRSTTSGGKSGGGSASKSGGSTSRSTASSGGSSSKSGGGGSSSKSSGGSSESKSGGGTSRSTSSGGSRGTKTAESASKSSGGSRSTRSSGSASKGASETRASSSRSNGGGKTAASKSSSKSSGARGGRQGDGNGETSVLRELLTHELGDLLFAERVFLASTRTMAREAQDPQVKARVEEHVRETEGQIERLREAFATIGERPKPEKCAAALGLKEEHDSFKSEEKPGKELLSAFDLGSGLRVEHYEIAAYRSTIAVANALGEKACAQLLTDNLKEEMAMASFLEKNAPLVLRKVAAAGKGGILGRVRSAVGV